MQVPGTPNTTNNSFHGAKVRNFYIFGGDEIVNQKSTHLPVCIQRGPFVFFSVANILFFFTQAIRL